MNSFILMSWTRDLGLRLHHITIIRYSKGPQEGQLERAAHVINRCHWLTAESQKGLVGSQLFNPFGLSEAVSALEFPQSPRKYSRDRAGSHRHGTHAQQMPV